MSREHLADSVRQTWLLEVPSHSDSQAFCKCNHFVAQVTKPSRE